MAKIVITKTAVKMIITYNTLASDFKSEIRNINRAHIFSSDFPYQNDCVQLVLITGEIISLIHTDVDKVDTVAPISNADLADKISNLML